MLSKAPFALHSHGAPALFLISLLAFFATVSTTTANRGAVRASQRASSIDCLYAKKAITYPNREYKTIDQCIINYDGHAHDLPEGLIDQSSYVSGQSTFRIHGASLQKSNDNSITIGGLDNAKIEMIERRQRRRLPWTTTGTHIVLAIRVTSLDAQVIYDQGTIGELLFGDGVTLKNVYSNCSFGKLNIVPYQGPGVVNGVAEMFYNGTVAGQNPQAVENSLTNVIRATYGWEGVAYQHIMIMLPPGTEPAFLAYTYVGNYRSVFNNDWAGYVSANVHEFGHTLGLQHSSRGGNEYMDQTGYMGYSYATIGSPSKCFNGHKNYLLGWYSDRFLPITPSVLPWTGNLVTFVDYDDALPNEPVLIQINDLYLQYNRAKSFNYQTKQNQDQVTITQAINASVISAAVGSVSMSNTTYTVFNYQGSETLLIEACSQQFVSDNGRADLYQISIYLESQISGCLSVLPDNQAPTPAPIRPTIFPVYVTAAPSRATPKPTKIVQLTTIATPKPVATVKPTAASKPNSKPPTRSPRRTPPPTPRPILSPTSFPTLLPTSPTNIFQHQSSPPTSAVATKCVDGSGTFRYRAASRNCQWLLIRPSTQSSLCVQGQAAYQLCKKTCNACS